jgi:hypothetical protein
MNWKAAVLGIVAVACCTPAHAVKKWTGLKAVTGIQVVEHGGFIVYFDSDVDPACTAGGPRAVYVYANEQGLTAGSVQAMLSLSTTALSENIELNALYDDATPRCFVSQVTVQK